MVENFRDVYAALQKSQSFQEFDMQDYVLAHGFVQLNAKGKADKPWHIGYYSKERDNLAIFSAPEFSLSYDEAFKDGGTIAPLEFMEGFQSTDEILSLVHKRLREAYSHEIPYTFIVILQSVGTQPRYNITVVTQAFKMINFQIDPLSGAITKEDESSVMDLKAEQA